MAVSQMFTAVDVGLRTENVIAKQALKSKERKLKRDMYKKFGVSESRRNSTGKGMVSEWAV